MFPVSAQPKDKSETGGPFDRAIEKGTKAIKLHSIQTKPKKKAGWRNNPKQVAFQNQEEYNPFLKYCWLLIGQGQFYNADFLQASATFSYIARHYKEDPEVMAEARIWQARSYAEMDWLYEAEDVLNKLDKSGIPKANLNQYNRIYADYLIKNGQEEEAIPYLLKAIKAEKNSRQRSRQRYLLGQLYAQQGQNALAYEAFGTVPRSNPPYELEFAARIRQTEVYPKGDTPKVINRLKRMSKSPKNKDYLDQVYYAIGNIYMSEKDTANAIDNYRLGIEKSTQNGLDKAICQIRLGDIYFQQQDYIHAQPCFSGALAGIGKEFKDYERVSELSAVLDELVVYAEAVHLQDSLQYVAKMPEKERLARIDSVIEAVIKQEKEAEELAKKEAYLAEQESKGSALQAPAANPATLPMASSDGSFYFYNPQLIAQGKTQFQNKWGRRTLEDNWRRRKKQMSTFDDSGAFTADSPLAVDSQAAGSEPLLPDSALAVLDSLASDPHQREYYLRQLPLMEEDIEASNLIIIDGLFNMAMIYKDKLQDLPLSIRAFDELERRFPDHKYRLDSYFNQFLMALQMKDHALAEQYKNRLIRAFPESDYAVAIADPNYEQNMRNMDSAQNSIYEQTYNSYLSGDTTKVRTLYKNFSEQYPLGTLMPKFMFLNALTYVQAGDAEGFKTALKELIDKYPDADVTELASEMLKGILRGRSIVQGGITGMTWNLRFGMGSDGSLSAEDSARVFSPETEAPHRMLLIYPTGSVDKNQLLFAVAAYNFANFQVKSFDLGFEESGPVSILTISGFNTMDEIIRYYRMIYGKDGYAVSLDRIITIIPISDHNNETLMRGKTLDEYMDYFAEHFKALLPEFITRQQTRLDAEEEAAETEKEQQKQAPAKVETKAPAKEVPAEKTASDRTEEVPPTKESVSDSLPEEEPVPELRPVSQDTTRIDTVSIQSPMETQMDTTAATPQDSVPAPIVAPTDESRSITLKELEEMRKRETEEAQAQEKAEKEAREAELKAREKQRKEEAQTREELRKQKEKEQKEKLKQREKEQKEKKKARKAELREREKLRKQQLKEREAARRAAQKAKQKK